MKGLFFVALCTVLCSVAHATDLYNDLSDTTASAYYGDWDGGAADAGGGTNYGLQSGQLFTSSITGTLTSVEGIFENETSAPALTGVLVQLYNFSGGVAGSLVGQEQVSGSLLDLGHSRYYSNFYENDVSATVNIAGLVSGQQYIAVLQPQGANWGWLEANADGALDTYLRDYSSFGYAASYGVTSWTESGTFAGFDHGDSVMRIQGVAAAPEPCSVIALMLGAVAALRRKK